jgi:MORN repeat
VRNGYGEMVWVDGSVYKGYWENGIQHGLGVMVFPDGFKKIGFFSQNIFTANLDDLDQVKIF